MRLRDLGSLSSAGGSESVSLNDRLTGKASGLRPSSHSRMRSR